MAATTHKANVFTVVLTPENGKWNAEVPDASGAITWGRSLSEARRNAIEAIEALAISEGRKAPRVTLQDDIRLPARAAKVTAKAREARRVLEEAQEQSNAATARAVAELTSVGLSVRDVGNLLGISHQRVAQIIESASKKAG